MKLKKFKFKKVKSTNYTAIRIIKNSNYKSVIVISDKQIRGKGQYGKKWISYKGNLFISFFYELTIVNLFLMICAGTALGQVLHSSITTSGPSRIISGYVTAVNNVLGFIFGIDGIGIGIRGGLAWMWSVRPPTVHP